MDSQLVRRLGPLIAVLSLLAVAAVAASMSTPQIRTLPLPGRHATPAPAAPGAAPSPTPSQPVVSQLAGALQRPMDVSRWLLVATEGLCALAMAAVLGVLAWYLLSLLARRTVSRRDSVDLAPQAHLDASPQPVLAALDAGLADLDDADADARRAVIACWVRLEEAAAAAGTPREPGDTAGDLVLRLLSTHQVSSPVLADFSRVYLAARYGTHEVDQAMRAQARAALRQLRAELINKAPGGGEPVVSEPVKSELIKDVPTDRGGVR